MSAKGRNQPRLAGHYEAVRAEFAGVSDGDLWQLAQNHDGRAFGALFERHASAVYNHCFRRTASWSTAEDLTSVVFLETWRRREEVQLHGDSILPWLLAVANNSARNASRSLRRHQRLLAKLTPTEMGSGFEQDVDQRVDDERSMAKILAALNKLRIEEREIIALCDWSALSYAEAASALAIPIGTVRSRLSRAHEHVRGLMDNELNPERRAVLATLTESPEEPHAPA